tara:strand:+ start:127009 stop:127194 length:186 start_codon:yes stop_codon:yes gene_type:complete
MPGAPFPAWPKSGLCRLAFLGFCCISLLNIAGLQAVQERGGAFCMCGSPEDDSNRIPGLAA